MLVFTWHGSHEQRSWPFFFVLFMCTLEGNYYPKCSSLCTAETPWKYWHELKNGRGAYRYKWGEKVNKIWAHKCYPKINIIHYISTSKNYPHFYSTKLSYFPLSHWPLFLNYLRFFLLSSLTFKCWSPLSLFLQSSPFQSLHSSHAILCNLFLPFTPD